MEKILSENANKYAFMRAFSQHSQTILFSNFTAVFHFEFECSQKASFCLQRIRIKKRKKHKNTQRIVIIRGPYLISRLKFRE